MQRKTLEEKREDAKEVVNLIKKSCNGPFIPRDKVGVVTNGAITPKTMSNLDSLGQGPEGSFYIRRKRVYPVDNFCSWLIERIEVTA